MSSKPSPVSIGSIIVQVADPYTKKKEDIEIEFYNDGNILASRKAGNKSITTEWTPIQTLCYYAPTLSINDIDIGGKP